MDQKSSFLGEIKLRKIVREEIQNELSLAKNDLVDSFTKIATDFKSNILNLVDKVMGELKTILEQQEIITGKTSDHEERLEKLEKLHPEAKLTPL